MTAFDKAFEQVATLVNTFSSNTAHYMSAGYSEAQARQDFIDKFFTALGWDVNHTTQTNPYEQEVKIELSQKQQNESARKRADYAFYQAPNFKDEVFFVEAKKPSVLIDKNAQHYFQTIRYGWNAGCPISVLTDFEEFVIVDCRSKPDIKYALNGKHKNYRYTDYANKEKFGEIYWLFSKEAVANNSIKKYAESLPKGKGKSPLSKWRGAGGEAQTIDDSFLEYIDGVRENLAKAFKKNDDSLTGEQLTEATQRTVDRLVFIRFLEDKFIEAESHINEWHSWKDFVTDCRKLDAKYNGVVFKKHFIDEQDFAGAEADLFKDICQEISSLNSPYNFNYIPIHILGSIYERFLGKVIRVTNKRSFVEEKPEVRKAGGVYYTPKYIVDYIVQNTVGKIIAGKTPKQIAALHFADIACGSGSFLIGVYDCLLDYHRKYYTASPPAHSPKGEGKRTPDGNAEYRDGAWQLTLKLKQDILLNNVYGVDIDAQAVEVTQLSLFLKMLEDESLSSTQPKQGSVFSKVLPDLTKNIVCGNSLIGFDIMNMNGQTSLSFGEGLEGEAELKKLNPMDYAAKFPAIMRSGGFDAIVGNPPYVDIKGLNPVEVDYYFKCYKTTENRINLYAVFIEKALSLLNKKALFGYIVPNSILYQSSYLKLRKLILNTYNLNEIVRVPDNVFIGVKAETAIFILGNEAKNENVDIILFDRNERISVIDKERTQTISQKTWKEHSLATWDVYGNPAINLLLNKLETNTIPLSTKVDFCLGLTPYDAYKGHTKKQIEERVFHSEIPKDKTFKKILEGSNVQRYLVDNNVKEYISYGEWLGAPRDRKFFTSPRILVRQIVSGNPLRIFAGYTEEELYNAQSIFNVVKKENESINLHFLTAILNSSLINFYHRYKYLDLSKNLFQKILIQNCKQFPIPKKVDSNKEKQIVNCVTQLLAAKQQQALAKTEKDKNFIDNKCQSLDRQIDELVYSLYGLSEEEIGIVEG